MSNFTLIYPFHRSRLGLCVISWVTIDTNHHKVGSCWRFILSLMNVLSGGFEDTRSVSSITQTHPLPTLRSTLLFLLSFCPPVSIHVLLGSYDPYGVTWLYARKSGGRETKSDGVSIRALWHLEDGVTVTSRLPTDVPTGLPFFIGGVVVSIQSLES